MTTGLNKATKQNLEEFDEIRFTRSEVRLLQTLLISYKYSIYSLNLTSYDNFRFLKHKIHNEKDSLLKHSLD